jgi:DNA-binding NarL/FixJ family response regulator
MLFLNDCGMIKIFLFLADGYRDVVATLLDHLEDMKMVGTSARIDQWEREVELSNPDVILIGHHFSSGNAMAVIERMKTLYPEKKVIIFSNEIEGETIRQSVTAGADGYVLLSTPLLKLIGYIREAHEGGAPMSPPVARYVLHSIAPVNNVRTLTNSESFTMREVDTLRLLVKGLTYKQISSQLEISLDTVRSHIKNIYSKLEVNSKSEAIVKVLTGRMI